MTNKSNALEQLKNSISALGASARRAESAYVQFVEAYLRAKAEAGANGDEGA